MGQVHRVLNPISGLAMLQTVVRFLRSWVLLRLYCYYEYSVLVPLVAVESMDLIECQELVGRMSGGGNGAGRPQARGATDTFNKDCVPSNDSK